MTCDLHPGVTFSPATQCFVCDPDPVPMWREMTDYELAAREKFLGPSPLDEMVASGHWPPSAPGPVSPAQPRTDVIEL